MSADLGSDPADEVIDLRRQLAASEARFHGVVERSSDGVLVVDRRGVVRFANQAATELMRRPKGGWSATSWA